MPSPHSNKEKNYLGILTVKGKPHERVGRKAAGLSLRKRYGSRVAGKLH